MWLDLLAHFHQVLLIVIFVFLSKSKLVNLGTEVLWGDARDLQRILRTTCRAMAEDLVFHSGIMVGVVGEQTPGFKFLDDLHQQLFAVESGGLWPGLWLFGGLIGVALRRFVFGRPLAPLSVYEIQIFFVPLLLQVLHLSRLSFDLGQFTVFEDPPGDGRDAQLGRQGLGAWSPLVSRIWHLFILRLHRLLHTLHPLFLKLLPKDLFKRNLFLIALDYKSGIFGLISKSILIIKFPKLIKLRLVIFHINPFRQFARLLG